MVLVLILPERASATLSYDSDPSNLPLPDSNKKDSLCLFKFVLTNLKTMILFLDFVASSHLLFPRFKCSHSCHRVLFLQPLAIIHSLIKLIFCISLPRFKFLFTVIQFLPLSLDSNLSRKKVGIVTNRVSAPPEPPLRHHIKDSEKEIISSIIWKIKLIYF